MNELSLNNPSIKGLGTLYVVATPIGNLSDMTLRALETLKAVDAIAAEDTRHTSGLLSHFGISKKLLAVHEHNERQSAEKLLLQLKAGENIALVTDAGTPGISDPGAVVVDFVRKAGVKVVPIPGVSAVIAALSASGISQNGFLFHGFLPASGAARRKVLDVLKTQKIDASFVAKYILNKKYQLLKEELFITPKMVLFYQQHISSNQLKQAMFLYDSDDDSVEDFETISNKDKK